MVTITRPLVIFFFSCWINVASSARPREIGESNILHSYLHAHRHLEGRRTRHLLSRSSTKSSSKESPVQRNPDNLARSDAHFWEDFDWISIYTNLEAMVTLLLRCSAVGHYKVL